MRYRRVSYRYSLVFAQGGPRPLGDTWRTQPVQLAQPCWRPPADVYETERTVYVVVELAGVNQEDVEVLLFDDALVVQGDRRIPAADMAGMYHAAEIRQGPFRLEVPLSMLVDAERVDAVYDRGLLQITLDKPSGR